MGLPPNSKWFLPPNFKCLRLQIWPQNSLRVPGDLICQGKQFYEIFSGDQSLQNIPWNELLGERGCQDQIQGVKWKEARSGRYLKFLYHINIQISISIFVKFAWTQISSDRLSSIDTGATSAAKKSIDFYRSLSCQKIFHPLFMC